MTDKYGYTVANVNRFLKDPNYLYKGMFFRKEFAEYRIEIFKLCK
jgi:hypothetical protein